MKKSTLFSLVAFLSPATQASALYFYEIGTEDTALAGAGQAARAQDASTIVTNPAGMTRLPDHMFTGGLQAMDGDISYRLDDDSGSKNHGDIMRFFQMLAPFIHRNSMIHCMPGWGYMAITGWGLILVTGLATVS